MSILNNLFSENTSFPPFCRCVVLLLSVVYLGLLYGLYVPDWQFVEQSDSSMETASNYTVYLVIDPFFPPSIASPRSDIDITAEDLSHINVKWLCGYLF